MAASYISRRLEGLLKTLLLGPKPRGLVLSGIVGCGKTTLIEHVCQQLGRDFEVLQFSGDDIQFRVQVQENSRHILNEVHSRTQRRALVFVDEIQKSPEVLDNLKVAFDEKQVSFIVSGSNPAYLATEANHRLQRRSVMLHLVPFTPNELLANLSACTATNYEQLAALLQAKITPQQFEFSTTRLPQAQQAMRLYAQWGGLPLVQQESSDALKMLAVQQVVERSLIYAGDISRELFDIVWSEIAAISGQEFAFQGVLQRTRQKRREKISRIIQYLMDQGYLLKKSPKLFHQHKSSYLFVLSLIDPGIRHYLTGRPPDVLQIGHVFEDVVHTGLRHLQNFVFARSQVHYFKPYEFDVNKQIKYLGGEIDFLFESGSSLVPIEVKSASSINHIDTSTLDQFLSAHALPFGIVLYLGEKHYDAHKRILYLPLWVF